MFELHAQLKKDCFELGNFKLSTLLMMNDYHYPWFILVPKVENIKESFELSPEDQDQLSQETNEFAAMVKTLFKAHKMNIAALGNMVPQLHVHVIARYDFDTCWPHPVWGRAQHLEFEKAQLLERIELLMQGFNNNSKLEFCWHEQWL